MANSHVLVVFLCLALVVVAATGVQFKVGGSGSWAVPTDPNTMSYNQWAERSRFRIGDSLLFVYPAGQDSVLQVDKEAYDNCNTSSYIQRFEDGNTVFTLERSGLFFFISGVHDNCIKKESVIVLVMGNHGSSSNPQSPPPSPSPSPSTSEGSSSPPTSSPPPAPEGSSPPPPPPTSSPPPPPESSSPPPPTDITPSTAPAGGEFSTPPPPPNAASVEVMGFMSFLGALFGPLLLVL